MHQISIQGIFGRVLLRSPVLESIKEIQTWRAHNIGCPVYGMAYRMVSDAEAKKDVPDRLFTSSTEGQIREWDPETGENKNETIITVRIFFNHFNNLKYKSFSYK